MEWVQTPFIYSWEERADEGGREASNGVTNVHPMCWCNYNNNGNNTTRNWIILLNIIDVKKGNTQHYLDWGAALALFKEVQALGWLKFVTGADCLWLISPRIQQPNKCCMAKTTSAQPLVHISNPISKTIHVSPLVITIKKNKIVSLLFNVGVNIFHNSSSSILTPSFLHLCCNNYSF